MLISEPSHFSTIPSSYVILTCFKSTLAPEAVGLHASGFILPVHITGSITLKFLHLHLFKCSFHFSLSAFPNPNAF